MRNTMSKGKKKNQVNRFILTFEGRHSKQTRSTPIRFCPSMQVSDSQGITNS